ncbi:ABC transporter ATP-binding protein [bacterium]|nr:ABC transporter ATP-binding protein [bacterium]
MPSAHLLKTVPVHRSARVIQLEGMFDLPPSQQSKKEWNVSLPIEERAWNIGLIVGPSGSGKTTIAHAFFGASIIRGFDWPTDQSILDGFDPVLSIKEVTGLLSSVGFSSPPGWLKPFHVLSNGEQFRCTIARALAEPLEMVVVDEFTSVVDRTVARIGSAAIAKGIRKRGTKFIALSCHEDILDWLSPDWIYRTDESTFSWRSLRPRPSIELQIRQTDRSAWRTFHHHHYLSGNLSQSARCFIGEVEGHPAAFTAVLFWPHPTRSGWREHRTICLPDFQGVGIGNGMSEFVASLFRATGRPYRSVTSSPAMIRHRARSPHWKMTRSPSRIASEPRLRQFRRSSSIRRMTASFEYVGPARVKEARRFGILKAS